MKKKFMKLHLNRETLRNMTEGDLQEVAGGRTVRTCETNSCDATCDCSIPTTAVFCCN